SHEVLGKNCRFLQGELTESKAIKLIKEALNEKRSIQLELVNYHKNGNSFWNRLSITPVFTEDGEMTHLIGVQDDVTALKITEALQQHIAKEKLVLETSIQAQEKERLEIGKELHDNINQMLTTVKLMLNMAADFPDRSADMIQKGHTVIGKAIEEVRRLSKQLVGPGLEEISLQDSLQHLIADLHSLTGLNFYLQFDLIDESVYEHDIKLIFYRIIQEQINNIIKHAKATKVEIIFTKQADHVHVFIKDNGVGFDPKVTPNGIGLRNIANRVELLRGKMHIQTAAGEGCTMHLSIPV
ncbi:MAG TPA: PAS domain-containing protein, partial [Flavisolibacter sp.]|nr:PAS domain-containing protein [Flavisolibacter sp.]